jgi:hypothetical protein
LEWGIKASISSAISREHRQKTIGRPGAFNSESNIVAIGRIEDLHFQAQSNGGI